MGKTRFEMSAEANAAPAKQARMTSAFVAHSGKTQGTRFCHPGAGSPMAEGKREPRKGKKTR